MSNDKHSMVAKEMLNIKNTNNVGVQFIIGWFDVAPFTQLVFGGLLHQQREFPHEVTTELVLLQSSRHHG